MPLRILDDNTLVYFDALEKQVYDASMNKVSDELNQNILNQIYPKNRLDLPTDIVQQALNFSKRNRNEF